MISAGTVLNGYLQINLLLMVSYSVFRLCQRGSSSLHRPINFTSATRLGQTLILASLLLPMILAFTPAQKMPRLSFSPAQPLSDGMGVALRTRAGPRIQSALPDFVSSKNGRQLNWMSFLQEAKRNFIKSMLFALLLGFGLVLWRLLKSFQHLRSIIREGVMIRKIGRVVVLVSDSVSVPISTLINFYAVILVPPSIVANAKDLRIAIRHELQHHRQRDTAWAIAIEFFVCLFFANPAIYFWKRQIIELQEFSCDEALLGRRGVLSQDYGGCLIRVAEAALENRHMLVGTACMAAGSKDSRYFKSFLRRRIEMFTEHRISRRTRAVAISLGTLSLLTTVTVAYGAQQALRPKGPAVPNPGVAVFDPTVQGIAEKELQAAIKRYEAKAGFILVSDPMTGRLLAAANITKDLQKQTRAWSLSYLLEPASVMKGIATATALDQHAVTLDEQLNCENGQYLYGHNVFHDWTPFKSLSTTDTVVNSSNICGIKIGERLGVNSLSKMLNDFGFGSGGTTQGFPEAAPGDIPRPSQLAEEEYVALVATGYTLQAQFTITPLEMVQAYGAIANGGKLMKAVGAMDPESYVSVVRQVVDASTAEGMKGVLTKVVTDGTGKLAHSALYTTAGKTSTAYSPEAPEHDNLGGERSIAGFVGFAPVDKPKVVIYVAIIEPKNLPDHQPHGSEQAAPVFRQVAEQVLQSMNVEPNQH